MSNDDALLSENDQKERLSVAYVSAIAARAGYCVSQPDLDRDSVDIEISAGGDMRPRLHLQLKATSSPKWHKESLHLVLKRKNYDDLRHAKRFVPLILVVFELPANKDDWLLADPCELKLRKSAWWMSLSGQPAINTDHKTVHVPSAQNFTPMVLQTLMGKVRGGSL